MAPKPTCANCKKKILDKHFLKCSQCKRSYDLCCTNSEKLYDLMDKERKESWLCTKCRQHKIQPESASTPITSKRKCVAVASTSHQLTAVQRGKINELSSYKPMSQSQQKTQQQFEDQHQGEQHQPYEIQRQPMQQEQQQINCSLNNVTKRKYNVPIRNSFESLSGEEFDISTRNDTLNRSCPNMTINYQDEVEVLKNKIANLQEKLEFSDSFSTKLLMENDTLKKQITAYTRQIDRLKDICKTTTAGTKTATKASKHQSSQTSLLIAEKKVQDQEVGKAPEHLNLEFNEITTEKSEVKQDESNLQRNIFILGGKQSRGLAAALLRSRQKTIFEKYQVSSTIKPDARCEDILESFESRNTRAEDVFIVTIGESDSNPTKLIAELCAFLKTHGKSLIIVTGVKNSIHLNEHKLNYTVKLLCKNFENCEFLDVTELNHNHTSFLLKLCNKINLIIDSRYYADKYLSLSKLNLKMNNSPKGSAILNKSVDVDYDRKGTIPYYFKKISLNVSAKEQKTLIQKSITEYLRQGDANELQRNNFFRPSK